MKRLIPIFLTLLAFLLVLTCEKTVIKYIENGNENTDSVKTVQVYYKFVFDRCPYGRISVDISYITLKETKYLKYENKCLINWTSDTYTFKSGDYIELSINKYYSYGSAYGGCGYIYVDNKVWKYFCFGDDLRTKNVCGNVP